MSVENKGECFVIMPISNPDGYQKGHFKHVYDDIIAPACKLAGYDVFRADDQKSTNLIHLDILNKLIEAPLVICDLSSRNPNVLFELGIRQAFDKPVVLIQEEGTEKIFDISPLRILDYSRDMKYHEVIKSQQDISDTITETIKNTTEINHINSIVSLLAINKPALIPEIENGKENFEIRLLREEFKDIKKMMHEAVDRNYYFERQNNNKIWKGEEGLERALSKITDLYEYFKQTIDNDSISLNEKSERFGSLIKEIDFFPKDLLTNRVDDELMKLKKSIIEYSLAENIPMGM